MGLQFFLFFVSAILFQACLPARQPYHATVTVDTTSGTVSDPNLLDLTHDLRAASLQILVPNYTPTSAASIGINLRGIEALAAFPTNSSTLIVTIPQTGDLETFTGTTRDESLALFKEFIRDGRT